MDFSILFLSIIRFITAVINLIVVNKRTRLELMKKKSSRLTKPKDSENS